MQKSSKSRNPLSSFWAAAASIVGFTAMQGCETNGNPAQEFRRIRSIVIEPQKPTAQAGEIRATDGAPIRPVLDPREMAGHLSRRQRNS